MRKIIVYMTLIQWTHSQFLYKLSSQPTSRFHVMMEREHAIVEL